MKLWQMLIFWFIGYCVVAGFAWLFVLELTFPIWKLFIISGIQVVVNTIGTQISRKAGK